MKIAEFIEPAVLVVSGEPQDQMSKPRASFVFSNSEPVSAIINLMNVAHQKEASCIEINALIDSLPDEVLVLKKKDALSALRMVYETELHQTILDSFKPKSQQSSDDSACVELKLNVSEAAVGLFGELWKLHKHLTKGMDLREALRYVNVRGQRDKDQIVAMVCGIGF